MFFWTIKIFNCGCICIIIEGSIYLHYLLYSHNTLCHVPSKSSCRTFLFHRREVYIVLDTDTVKVAAVLNFLLCLHNYIFCIDMFYNSLTLTLTTGNSSNPLRNTGTLPIVLLPWIFNARPIR